MDITGVQAVRARLAALGVSQHALARALGVSQATLSLWLNGYRKPPTGFEAAATAELDLLEAGRAGRGGAADEGAGGGTRTPSRRVARPPAESEAWIDITTLAPTRTDCRRCCCSTTSRRCCAVRRRRSSGDCGRRSSRWRRWRESTSGPGGAGRRCCAGWSPAVRATRCAGGGGRGGERDPRREDGEAGCRVAGGGPGVRRPRVRLPAVLAGSGARVVPSAGRDGSEVGGAAPVGALRRVRSGGRVLMQFIERCVRQARARWRDHRAVEAR